MKIKPLGFYVLIELVEVDAVSDGGIIMPTDLIDKEQDATDIGYVRAIGPTAFVGYPGCDAPEGYKFDEDDPEHFDRKKWNHAEAWGLKVGQKIEYRRFEGKKSAEPGYENYRYLPDSHIIGVISEGE